MNWLNQILDRDQRPITSGKMIDDGAFLVYVRPQASLGIAKQVLAGEHARGAPGSSIIDYARANCLLGARVRPLYPGRARAVIKRISWDLAVTDPTGDDEPVGALHHVRLAWKRDREKLIKAMEKDPGIVSFHEPVIQYPLDAPAGGRAMAVSTSNGGGWGLDAVGFDTEVLGQLSAGADSTPIAVIDQGGYTGHPDLTGRLTERYVLKNDKPSRSIHACQVAGIISAIRSNGIGCDGLSSAQIDLYNTWTEKRGFDSFAYHAALAAFADGPARVANISLGSPHESPVIQKQITDCVAKGKVVVAAMGNGGTGVFPARYNDVIAVGAIDRSDSSPQWASKGDAMFISAPGEYIGTLSGKQKTENASGTSFAAPFVTAAVWMILRARPCWGLEEIRKILKATADTTRTSGKRTPDFGYGMLNMKRLADALADTSAYPLC